MIITKKEAEKEGLMFSKICNFHISNPDQQATLESCQDCKVIEDPCGCGIDEGCPKCEPESFKRESQK